MFLKALEIKGFKSFANAIDITFNNGITTIVGPNGSGKSNISDAVRWVLGEQNVRNLRGDKMEDIIFSGTQYRKPIGMAQVSLTLDNNDNQIPINYSYIKVTRRLYRSGQSEYSINNTVCRLKDIQELFMDTGIGKEGYSIISQGKIEEILNGKHEDRRKLIEEAVGIVKFKTRKEEAQRKLQNTEQNLIRINDILKTYEERIPSLRLEKDKAKQFITFSDNLKSKEINVILDEINKAQDKNRKLKAELNVFNDKSNMINITFKKLNEKENNLNKTLEQFDSNISFEKKQFYDKKSQYKDIMSEIDILNERVNNIKEYINKNLHQIDENQLLMTKLKDENNKKIISINELKIKQKEIIENSKKLNDKYVYSKLSVSDNEDVLKKLYNSKNEFNNNINNKNNEINICNNEINSLQKQLNQIDVSYQEYNKNNKLTKQKYEELKNEKQQLDKQIENYNDDIDKLKNDIDVKNNKILKNEEELNILTQKYNTLVARKQVLINFDNKYEGYNKSVKNLIKDIEDKKVKINEDQYHILGNIVNVKKDLETAIEIALGNSISNVITNNEETAKNLIKHLRKNKLGRVTFLPINIVKGNKINLKEEVISLDGFIGIASQLVEYNKNFNNIINYVLGRTLICDNMDNALNIAKKINYKYKIVTLEGDVINHGGALTGGSSYHKTTNIFSRKREIKDLEVEICDLTNKIDSIKDLINNENQKLKDLEQKSLDLKDNVYSKNIKIAKVESELSKLNLEIKNYVSIIESIDKQTKENKNLLNNKDLKIKQLQEKLNVLIKDNIENDEEINKIKDKLSKSKQNYDDISNQVTELKIKEVKINEIILNKVNEKNRIATEIKNMESKHKEFKLELEKLKQKYNDNLKCISSNKGKINSILNYIEKVDSKLKEKEIERIKIKNNIENNKQEIDQIRLLIRENDKQINRYKILLAKYETEIQNLYDKLNEKFNLTFAEALEYKIQNINVNNLKHEIIEIKNKISKLGVVNLGAITEYDELKQKFDFMNSQRQDLVRSKDELDNVINDLTNNMRIVFKKNFKKIKVLFNETFKQLFKGGTADLILGEGDELSARIEINVQPPGKKLQNINLMSGGEKVLSAIALLFAILKMKPTPFCILDEIEAALDDANVRRFAEFLRKFSSNIQFVVITHRKITMEVSDTMYGITMQEKGISKIASLNIKEEFS